MNALSQIIISSLCLAIILALSSCGQTETRSQYTHSKNKAHQSNIPVVIVKTDGSQKTETREPSVAVASAAIDKTNDKTEDIAVEEQPAVFGDNVVIQTSVGVIELQLYPDLAPISVANFLQYIADDFYNKTVFHRVMPGFMIQGGGMTIDVDANPPQYVQKPTRDTIKNESGNGLSNKRGTLAMARRQGADTASSQFYINLVNNVNLNRTARSAGYAVFGKVVSGMDVVDAIAAVQCQSTVPVQPIFIISVVRIINWNRAITGASGKLPFGGVGCSGNFRSSALHAVDYCHYTSASIEGPTVRSSQLPIGIRQNDDKGMHND